MRQIQNQLVSDIDPDSRDLIFEVKLSLQSRCGLSFDFDGVRINLDGQNSKRNAREDI